jgi:DNA-binding NtrC family response regulator
MKADYAILVVDDDESIAHVLCEMLSDEGYPVTPALCGIDAIANLRGGLYRLVMLDLVLPDLHGIDLLREIKTTCPKSDVIVMTSYASVETAVEALRLGAADYLFKPFDDLDFVSLVVRKIFEKQRTVAENERLHQELTAKTADLESYVKRLALLMIRDGRCIPS